MKEYSTQPVFALVDCDNFFVSCERIFRPDIWGKPAVVLSNNDGCIVARSGEVKAMGDIPMGVPYFKVKSLLQQRGVICFSANFGLYGDFSRRVVRMLEAASPRVEVYSVDESFLEISSLGITDYVQWARALRAQIGKCLGIPVSIGIAPTKTLAKAAAELAKHSANLAGVYSVVDDAEAHEALLQQTPIKAVWGIGWRTVPKLQNRGVATAYDLSQVSDAWAQQQLTIRGLHTVKELRGEPNIPFSDDHAPQQTLAVTRTFASRVHKQFELEGQIARFVSRAAHKLRRYQQTAGAVVVFVAGDRHKDAEKYRRVSISIPLLQPSNDTGVLLEAALSGLERLYDPDFSYRRGGVVMIDLAPEAAQQLSWLAPHKPADLEKRRELMRVIDGINAKYHTKLIRHAVEPQRQSLVVGSNHSPAYTTSWRQLPRVKIDTAR